MATLDQAAAWAKMEEAWKTSIEVETTQRTYAAAWVSFRMLCVKPAWEVEQADIVQYRDDLERLGTKAGSIVTYLHGVGSCYRFALKQGLVKVNPCVGVDKPHVEMFGRGKFMTLAQAQKMVDVIERGTVAGRRDYAFVKLMLLTGLRSAEARNILRGDLVDLGDGRIQLTYKPKGEVEKIKRRVLPGAAWEALRVYLEDRGKLAASAPVFVGHHVGSKGETPISWNAASVMVEKYSMQALGEAFNQHSLRHATAEIVWRMSRDPRQVQEILGHKHLQTTMIYIQHFQDDRAEMGDQIQKALVTGEIPMDRQTELMVERVADVLVDRVAAVVVPQVVAALRAELGRLLGVG